MPRQGNERTEVRKGDRRCGGSARGIPAKLAKSEKLNQRGVENAVVEGKRRFRFQRPRCEGEDPRGNGTPGCKGWTIGRQGVMLKRVTKGVRIYTFLRRAASDAGALGQCQEKGWGGIFSEKEENGKWSLGRHSLENT